MQRPTLAAAVLLLGSSLVSPSIWAVDFSNGELSVSLPNDWEMESSDQYGTYFNSRDSAEQLVVPGKMHTISYYCYRCRTMDRTTIQRGEAILGAVKFHVPQ